MSLWTASLHGYGSSRYGRDELGNTIIGLPINISVGVDAVGFHEITACPFRNIEENR